MEEIVKTLPQHKCSWLKDRFVLYKYQDFWSVREFLEGQILAQQSFKARPSDHVFLCSHPKTGMTWLKALAFAIVTRDKYDGSSSPLLTTMPHGIVPFLEEDHEKIEDNHNDLCYPLVGTHLPYNSLPESILASNCKIVYIYRNIKDVIVSYYHFMRKVAKLPMEDAPFEEAFDEFYQGVSWSGPYWDHILGYWKASLEKPETTLFLKYEDLKKDPINNVKRLAEFIGYPFTIEEEKAGVIETIVKLCSFENLSNLEVNKSGKSSSSKKGYEGENRIFFRKATDGDWKNYFTDEMIEKIDKLVDQKLDGTGLVLK